MAPHYMLLHVPDYGFMVVKCLQMKKIAGKQIKDCISSKNHCQNKRLIFYKQKRQIFKQDLNGIRNGVELTFRTEYQTGKKQTELNRSPSVVLLCAALL